MVLCGITSSERYVRPAERSALVARQPPLGRAEATRAALIPISKSAAWWALSQDDRRTIFEERSHHIATGLEYLPAIARRLHHARDLGGPFDFLTWFEYAPAASERLEQLVESLRATEEWGFVVREVDIRLELQD
jgi:chlorite dismutase